MKKILVCFGLLLAAVLLFCSCQSNDPTNGKNPVPKDIVADIVNKGEFPEMLELDNDIVLKKYNVDKDILESCSVFICSSGAQADEVAVFKAVNLDQTNIIKDEVQKRADTIYADFKDYVPTEIPKIDDHSISVKGKYVFFIISSDPKGAKNIFDSYFN